MWCPSVKLSRDYLQLAGRYLRSIAVPVVPGPQTQATLPVFTSPVPTNDIVPVGVLPPTSCAVAVTVATLAATVYATALTYFEPLVSMAAEVALAGMCPAVLKNSEMVVLGADTASMTSLTFARTV